MSKTVRVLAGTGAMRKPVKWVFTYVHPMDDCSAGGSVWEITTREFAPGLIEHVHPCCSRCGIEPIVDGFKKVPDED